jgi:hypothetical protein
LRFFPEVSVARAIVPGRAGKFAELSCDSPDNQERRDYVPVENDAWSGRRRIGDIRMTVISNDYGRAYEGRGTAHERRRQRAIWGRRFIVSRGTRRADAGNEPVLLDFNEVPAH